MFGLQVVDGWIDGWMDGWKDGRMALPHRKQALVAVFVAVFVHN